MVDGKREDILPMGEVLYTINETGHDAVLTSSISHRRFPARA